jgi:hypothetical protein
LQQRDLFHGENQTVSLDKRFQPAMPGCAIASPGHVAGSDYGTLACRVRDVQSADTLYLLSASHVIANCGNDPLGLPVFQPGTQADTGNAIGVVARWGTIAFTSDGFPNLFDAAIATVDPGSVTNQTYGLGPPIGLNESVAKNTAVRKAGAKTEVTSGVVLNPNYHCEFTYPVAGVNRAGFQQQILCAPSNPGSPFVLPGDSGAAVVDDQNRVIGLVLGLTGDGVVVSPIGPILYSLQIELG